MVSKNSSSTYQIINFQGISFRERNSPHLWEKKMAKKWQLTRWFDHSVGASKSHAFHVCKHIFPQNVFHVSPKSIKLSVDGFFFATEVLVTTTSTVSSSSTISSITSSSTPLRTTITTTARMGKNSKNSSKSLLGWQLARVGFEIRRTTQNVENLVNNGINMDKLPTSAGPDFSHQHEDYLTLGSCWFLLAQRPQYYVHSQQRHDHSDRGRCTSGILDEKWRIGKLFVFFEYTS